MFVLPLGVEAKTRDIPFATLTIVVLVFFYSLWHWSAPQKFIEAYMEIPERRAYQVELKKYLDGRCPQLIDQATCQVFRDEVLPEQLRDANYVVKSLGQTERRGTRLSSDQLGQLKTFIEPWMKESEVLRYNEAGPEFQRLREKLVAAQAVVKKELREHKMFSALNREPVALARAQFLHSGWLHLIGNMVFFLLLAFPVEQRLGTSLFAVVYLAAGTVGLFAHTLGGEGLFIVGASANVFGIAGAFLALFYKQKMRLLVSFFFVSNRVVLVPVAVYFAFWIVLEEVLGVASVDGSNVAHGAHLGGFAVGFAISWIYQAMAPLGEGLIYPYEKIIQIRAQRTVKPVKLFNTFMDWLKMNPSSAQAATGLLISGRMLLKENPNDPGLQNFLKTQWPELFERNLKNSVFIEKVPLDWLRGAELRMDPDKLRKAVAHYHDSNHARAEWTLLIYVLWGCDERGFPELEDRLRKLTEVVLQEPDFVDTVQASASRSHELDQFFQRIGIWLANAKGSYAG